MIENSNEMFIVEAGKYIEFIPDPIIEAIRENNVNERPNIDFTGMRYE
jgi:hypothetical protein